MLNTLVSYNIYNQISNEGSLGKFNNILASVVLSSFIVYPLDLVSTRLSADMSNYDSKKIYSSVNDCLYKSLFFENSTRNNKIFRLFRGFAPFAMSSLVFNTSYLYLLIEKNPNLLLLSLYTTGLSLMIHPIDTYKRLLQLNTAVKFYNFKENFKFIDFFKLGPSTWYKGFTMQLGKSLLYPFVFYYSVGYCNQYIEVKNLENI